MLPFSAIKKKQMNVSDAHMNRDWWFRKLSDFRWYLSLFVFWR